MDRQKLIERRNEYAFWRNIYDTQIAEIDKILGEEDNDKGDGDASEFAGAVQRLRDKGVLPPKR